MSEHSEHGASSCKRWWNCPGSVALCRGIPDENSAYAQEGTDAHQLAALCLTGEQDAAEWVDRCMTRPSGDVIFITAEMAEAAQIYLDHVEAGFRRSRLACRRMIEHRFSLAPLNPPVPMFGTSDSVVISPPLLIVDDLKYGRGVQVEAVGNLQLRYYSLGALVSLPAAEAAQVRRVRASIIQPRAPGGAAIRTDEFDAVELVEWSMDLMTHAAATLAPDAPLVPGEWCSSTFCKARAVCPARAAAALAVASVEFAEPAAVTLPAPNTLTPADVGRALRLAPLLRSWLSDVEKHATAEISRGADVPGWKLVPTEGRSAWRDSVEAEASLDVLHGLGEDRYAPREIVSPSVARGLLAGVAIETAKLRGLKITKKSAVETARAALAPLIEIRSSGLKLAPDDDSRPAIVAGAEFSENLTE